MGPGHTQPAPSVVTVPKFAMGNRGNVLEYSSILVSIKDSTPTQIACMLAYNLSQQSPPFNISAPGASLSIIWKSNTQAGNVSFSATSSSTQTTYFATPSFYGCGGTCNPPTQNPQVYSASLSGGLDPTGPSLDHDFFVTEYSYDVLGNLLQVTQKGDPIVTDSSQWRVRSFTYNSLFAC